MHINLTPEQEAQLTRLAAAEEKSADDLAHELFSRGLTEEARFAAAVVAGQESARLGDFVDAAEVWAGVESVLQS